MFASHWSQAFFSLAQFIDAFLCRENSKNEIQRFIQIQFTSDKMIVLSHNSMRATDTAADEYSSVSALHWYHVAFCSPM